MCYFGKDLDKLLTSLRPIIPSPSLSNLSTRRCISRSSRFLRCPCLSIKSLMFLLVMWAGIPGLDGVASAAWEWSGSWEEARVKKAA